MSRNPEENVSPTRLKIKTFEEAIRRESERVKEEKMWFQTKQRHPALARKSRTFHSSKIRNVSPNESYYPQKTTLGEEQSFFGESALRKSVSMVTPPSHSGVSIHQEKKSRAHEVCTFYVYQRKKICDDSHTVSKELSIPPNRKPPSPPKTRKPLDGNSRHVLFTTKSSLENSAEVTRRRIEEQGRTQSIIRDIPNKQKLIQRPLPVPQPKQRSNSVVQSPNGIGSSFNPRKIADAQISGSFSPASSVVRVPQKSSSHYVPPRAVSPDSKSQKPNRPQRPVNPNAPTRYHTYASCMRERGKKDLKRNSVSSREYDFFEFKNGIYSIRVTTTEYDVWKKMRLDPNLTVGEATSLVVQRANIKNAHLYQWELRTDEGPLESHRILSSYQINHKTTLELRIKSDPNAELNYIGVINLSGKRESIQVDLREPCSKLLSTICLKYGYTSPNELFLTYNNKRVPLQQSLKFLSITPGDTIRVQKKSKSFLRKQRATVAYIKKKRRK